MMPVVPTAQSSAVTLAFPRSLLLSNKGRGEHTEKQQGDWRAVASEDGLILESWSQGCMVGALMLMICITIANMRKGVLLHKLILIEQIFALSHGTFCFMNYQGYGWYLSSTAALLYCSYWLHNYVAWLKVKPFFYGKTIFSYKFTLYSRWIYLSTLLATIPLIVFQIYNNFRFFNGMTGYYQVLRPYEPFFRDFWWLFSSGVLFYVLSHVYGMKVTALMKESPRFGMLLCAIVLSMIFTTLDIIATIHQFVGSKGGNTDGINPWWKFAVVFKDMTDAILLDDFKSELKRLSGKRFQRDRTTGSNLALIFGENEPGRSLSHNPDTEHDQQNRAYGSVSINEDPYLAPKNSNRSLPQTYANRSNEEKCEIQEIEHGDIMNDKFETPTEMSKVGENRKELSRHQISRGGIKATRLPRLFEPVERRKQIPMKRE